MAIYTELTKDAFPSIHITGYHVYAYLSPVKDPQGQTYSAWMYEPVAESATLITTQDIVEDAFNIAREALIARAEADGIDPHEVA